MGALDALFTHEHIHREEKLSIGSLAARLGLPEYKLRRLINQGLGHRNFNAFLNRYRIEDAKHALAGPARAAVPMLTLAMDCGFQSLGPFNRAFKAETGLIPTEFRRQHAAGPPEQGLPGGSSSRPGPAARVPPPPAAGKPV